MYVRVFQTLKSLDLCKQISVVHPISKQAGHFSCGFSHFSLSMPVKTWVKLNGSFLWLLQEDSPHLAVPNLARSFYVLNSRVQQRKGFRNKQYRPRYKSSFYKKQHEVNDGSGAC